MDGEIPFRFSIRHLPEGEALTGSEIELKLLEQVEAAGGKCMDSLWSLASLYQQSGHLDQASACVQEVIKLTSDPEKIGAAYLALGQLEESRGAFIAAAKHYREALAMEPCSTETWYFIHNNLGYSLNQTNEPSSAIPYLQRAIEIDPARPNAYKNLGLAHAALGDFVKAAELFIAATQVDASDHRSLDHLSSLIEANPVLEVDVPDLRDRVDACRKAVEFARARQPDFEAHWAELREQQKPRWWQFWKRSRRIDSE
jgi:tetratricopeptide (TPR) repeat protein